MLIVFTWNNVLAFAGKINTLGTIGLWSFIDPGG
jgi:hypothetical protein